MYSFLDILDSLPVLIWKSDLLGQKIFFGTTWSKLTGLSGTEMSDKWLQFTHPNDETAIQEGYEKAMEDGGLLQFEYRIRFAGDKYNWFVDNGSPLFDETGNIIGFIGTSTNIDIQKEKQAELELLVNCDKLTGLYNYRFYNEYLETMVNKRENQGLALIIADINGLKVVNDNLGHEQGSLLIKEVAKILRDTLRKEDVICRIGGDEFGIILSVDHGVDLEKGIDEVYLLNKVCKKVKNSIQQYNDESKAPWNVSVALGFSIFFGQDAKTIISKADEAMYQDKQLAKADVILENV